MGNHVHKLLKVTHTTVLLDNTYVHTGVLLYLLTQPEKREILCQSVVRVDEKNGGHLVEEATQVAELCKNIWPLLSLLIRHRPRHCSAG